MNTYFNNNLKKNVKIMATRKIAFPCTESGLDAPVSAHFGHSSGFTVVVYDEESFKIEKVEDLHNPPHEQGGCMTPVMVLKNSGVNEVIVGGIGQRPLMGFIQVGIDPYGGVQGTIQQNFDMFKEKRLQKIERSTCNHS